MKVQVTTQSVDSIVKGTETWSIPRDGVSPQHVIDKFNASLRPGEKPRIITSYELEVFCICPNAFTVFTIEDVKNDVEFNGDDDFMEFLDHPTPGAIYELDHPQYDWAIMIIKGYGKSYGLKIDLPNYEAESCEECGADANQMNWQEGQWHCPDCGEAQ